MLTRQLRQRAADAFKAFAKAFAPMAGNLPDARIFVTGNTVIDALLWVRDRVLDDADLNARVRVEVHRIDNLQLRMLTRQLRQRAADAFKAFAKTVIDALLWVRDRVLDDADLNARLAARYPFLEADKDVRVEVHRIDNLQLRMLTRQLRQRAADAFKAFAPAIR
jgi:UDP-N-acetylglucosamine 2-epimerase